MKFKVACFNGSNERYFNDEITFNSSLFSAPDSAALAVRHLYEKMAPEVEVLCITRVMEVERGFY